MQYAIQISNLHKNYAEVKAVKNVNINVKEGELFGLIGPDGAGKSSIIRILATLLLPSEGSAKLYDYDCVSDYKQIRNIIGYMPGKFSLYMDLTVEENLNLFAKIFSTTIETNYHLVKDIYSQIEPFKKRRAGQLSGGMKQKLALSCALIHKPKVLLLDEPTTGVDPVSRKEFWDMLKQLKNEGITIFVSTPYMDEASLCDEVALIQNGNILQVDTPENIIKKFPNQLFSVNAKEKFKLINDLHQFRQSASVQAFGETVHFHDLDFNNAEEIKNYLSSLGHQDIEINHINPSIEDCFIDLMGKA